MGQPQVIVIGAGLTGLATASALVDKGYAVRILEQADRPGGVIRSERVDGFLCEGGPNSMMLKSRQAETFLESVGLAAEIVEANPTARRRYLVRDGRPVALPGSLVEAIRTPLYTTGAKLRVLREPWVSPPPAGTEDTVATFVRRRLGPEFLDYGIAPLVSGIFAGDPEGLSIRYAFPKIWNLENEYGSLTGGAIKSARARKRSGEARYKSRIIAFREGMQMLPDRLAERLGDRVITRAELTNIEQRDSGWLVAWRDASGECSEQADAVVCTVPSVAWAELPWAAGPAEDLAAIPAPDYPPVATLMLGYRREQVEHPLDGFGMLVPLVEQRRILGAIFSSTLFEDRAPPGSVTFMIFIGGATAPERALADEDERLEMARSELRDLLGVRGDPVLARHTLWPRAIPQYGLGYGDFYAALERTESRWPGLYLQGNFRGGPGVTDCLTQSFDLAARIAA